MERRSRDGFSSGGLTTRDLTYISQPGAMDDKSGLDLGNMRSAIHNLSHHKAEDIQLFIPIPLQPISMVFFSGSNMK